DGAAQLLRAVTGVDILVNNAGIYGPQDFYATDDATWDNYWQTNVMSGVRLSRGLLPAMVSKGWGRVVFISSESARNIPADMIHYGVTKTAQLSLARGLAKYVAGSGVTVNRVLPGPTISDGFAEMLKDLTVFIGNCNFHNRISFAIFVGFFCVGSLHPAAAAVAARGVVSHS
ncbi:SDR family NAD(P)-dependent oxidoreductase, partial [Methylobacterium isbiliense]|uniref:SDR family NAD(P)-dependent oxidoreductase n=1 Tax=Methylobacterium isbiliense TaxID=315478 RepID=UPI0035E884ED